MRHLKNIVLGGLALMALSGCSYATGSVAGSNTVNGEIWYVEQTTLLPQGPTLGLTVYYCPSTQGGSAVCREAEMNSDGNPGTVDSAEATPPAEPLAPVSAPPVAESTVEDEEVKGDDA